MNLGRAKLARSSDPVPAPADEIRQRRVQSARACIAWTELEASALDRRERRFHIHGETDEIFVPVRGTIWHPLGRIAFGDQSPLYFVVDENDEVQVFEKRPGGTWSEVLRERQSKAGRSRARQVRR